MAAGGGSSSKASVGLLEIALDRKLQSVTNTMESIQGLSSWCIENKKQHATIVHYWMKWVRRSAFPHRLNLFYVANDVIQNCKRKNAIVFRETFAEVLPEAASLVKDASVCKSIERIFKIWEDRSMYPEKTIAIFRAALTAENPKAVLKSKIVAEFRPQSLMDELVSYKRTEDQIELKEKQLSTMRVDVCSTETLKRLKDKAGGKKFSKDFEEASAKLEEFVNGLDKQVKNGPSLMETLENAGIFYEAQYKEVKVVANAYKTFANRVSNLKKKLDQLKSTLPDPEESPLPSPSMDAPSPTGSESPFPGMGEEDSLSPASVTPEPAKDNRDVEDMELSDVDDDLSKIIVEERKEKQVVSTSSSTKTTDSVPNTVQSASVTPTTTSVASPLSATASPPTPIPTPPTPPSPTPPTPPTPTPAKTPSTGTTIPSTSLPLPNLANVDLAKISSILSSLTSVMKNTGVSPASRPSPGTPTTPTTLPGGLKTPVQGAAPVSQNPLANILSKVEITPESILSALSKTQVSSAPGLQGLSSLLQSVAGNTALSSGIASHSTSTSPVNTTVSSMKERNVPSNTSPFVPKSFAFSPNSSTSEVSSTSVSKTSMAHSPGLSSSSFKPPVNSLGFTSPSLSSTETSMSQSSEVSKIKIESESSSPTSLEMKIHNFLKGNPGFSGLNLNIPILSSLGSSNTPSESHSSDFHRGPTSTSVDNVDGTPVRDERSGTPTQDEMMDKPTSSNVDTMSLISKLISPGSSTPSSTSSPPQNRSDDYPQELSNSVPSYRTFSLGGNSSPAAYGQSTDTMEKNSSLMDSPQEKFYPDTSFKEDEDYRDFDYSGPPPSAMVNLEKKPAKSILKSSKHLDPTEYQSLLSSFGHQTQEFSVQSTFPPSIGSILDQKSCSQLSSPDMYGNYSLRENERGSDRSPSPSKSDAFFTPDSNHNSLSKSLVHSGLPQKQFPDSPHSVPSRPLFPTQTAHSATPVRPPVSNSETPLSSAISATSTIEFKNMLKIASRKPSDDKQFSQTPKGSSNEGPLSNLSQTGISAEEQQLQEEHYRIETRVSSSCLDLPDSTEEKGAPIETVGYHNSNNRRLSGEPIQTVESIRVLGKGNRGHGQDGGRLGWFEMSNTGNAFDKGPASAPDLPTASGNSGIAGFKSQYKEHTPHFQENVSNFRTNNFSSAFDHHIPPPPIAPPIDHGTHFQREQVVPPSGLPVAPPADHGSLFTRDHPVPPHMPPVDHTNPFSKETSAPLSLPHGVPPLPPVEHSGIPFPAPPLPPPIDHGLVPFSVPPPPPPPAPPVELGGIPFSPPPLLEHGGIPFGKDHNTLHPGAMNEHFNLHPGPPRELMTPPLRDHICPPLGRIQEGLTLPIHLRDQHGPSLSGPPPSLLGPPPRESMHQGGLMRNPRPDFRPRNHFQNRDPSRGLKRPRPPFGRGPPFFSPKRPFYPPRY
ncbi:regulation of nuclear pre-mRNA domain-containing protein 2 isoform X2 [Rhinatrema bivittatum]|uniref:regulation of nuclear pre-mRNA domain-containing protein 2 isoform X2 n=1 Tax=Rhinatrema bivittatum TaxID=194408 RepID=UPI00112EAF51|nr:regulation of nuclear pre-mRNA domain-containing protein 2 isoform X2 [Rhinatrema bivittatum]